MLIGCSSNHSSEVAAFEVFCEMVASQAKPIALSHPMRGDELDELWPAFEKLANQYDVSLYREQAFPVTPLFASSSTSNKEVVVIYRNDRLIQYQQLKADLDRIDPTVAARRLGRLLGYSPQGINQLLMANSEFRTLSHFEVSGQITHLYYTHLDSAVHFYEHTLGLEMIDKNLFQINNRVGIQLHSTSDEHPDGQPKSVAIALLTDQLPDWYQYLQEQNVPIKYTYKPKDGGPHDGFVAVDPGGYYLEFEQFKQHPENELFMATLHNLTRKKTRIDSLNFYGSITWTYHNDLLEMQNYYNDQLGFTMVADQGWTKIYQTAPGAYIGLVDERRGMMNYATDKAVEIEWKVENLDESYMYYSNNEQWDATNHKLKGPDNYTYLLK